MPYVFISILYIPNLNNPDFYLSNVVVISFFIPEASIFLVSRKSVITYICSKLALLSCCVTTYLSAYNPKLH